MNQNYNDIAGKKLQRIEALSDGVFAIAMTLLVLDIHVPLKETIHADEDLITAFSKLTPNFLSYLLSFMTLGIFWTGHSVQLNFINQSDRNLNWISLFFLLFVSILPFTTAFLSEYIEYRFAVGIYWFNILALGLVLYVHWNYAVRKKYIAIEGEQLKLVHNAINRRILVGQSLYAFGALLCFFNTYLSIIVIVLVQLNYALGIFTERTKD